MAIKILSFKLVPVFLVLIIASCAKADNKEIEQISEDAVNLSANIFLRDFVSQDPSVRKAARLYFLGVLDATEGKTWCGYKTLKTVSLNEFVFEKMKKLNVDELDRRASTVIEESLHELFPCGGK